MNEALPPVSESPTITTSGWSGRPSTGPPGVIAGEAGEDDGCDGRAPQR